MNPRSIFILKKGALPDDQVCGDRIDGPCPYSDNGRMPLPVPLTEDSDKGKAGDLCPPCCKQNLSSLEHWAGGRQETFNWPQELLPLRLFKCRMWCWLVVPGLRDDDPTVMKESHDNH